MKQLAETALAISKTSSRLKKVALLSEYFRDLPDDDLRAAAVFFTGRPFPLADARTLNVGGAALLRAIQEIPGLVTISSTPRISRQETSGKRQPGCFLVLNTRSGLRRRSAPFSTNSQKRRVRRPSKRL